jgi:hypothetical protein
MNRIKESYGLLGPIVNWKETDMEKIRDACGTVIQHLSYIEGILKQVCKEADERAKCASECSCDACIDIRVSIICDLIKE